MTAAPEGGTSHLHTHSHLTSPALMPFLRFSVDRHRKWSLITPVEKKKKKTALVKEEKTTTVIYSSAGGGSVAYILSPGRGI